MNILWRKAPVARGKWSAFFKLIVFSEKSKSGFVTWHFLPQYILSRFHNTFSTVVLCRRRVDDHPTLSQSPCFTADTRRLQKTSVWQILKVLQICDLQFSFFFLFSFFSIFLIKKKPCNIDFFAYSHGNVKNNPKKHKENIIRMC